MTNYNYEEHEKLARCRGLLYAASYMLKRYGMGDIDLVISLANEAAEFLKEVSSVISTYREEDIVLEGLRLAHAIGNKPLGLVCLAWYGRNWYDSDVDDHVIWDAAWVILQHMQ